MLFAGDAAGKDGVRPCCAQEGGNWFWFVGEEGSGSTGPTRDRREEKPGSRPSRPINSGFFDVDGGACDDGE